MKKLDNLYLKGPASFGNAKRLQILSKLSIKKVKMYLETEPCFTKYRSRRLRFPRLKVIVNDLNEIWSVDLAFVDKLAKYNSGVKYLLIAVDCLSRYLRVEPLKTKYATETAEAFKKMFKHKQPKVPVSLKLSLEYTRELRFQAMKFLALLVSRALLMDEEHTLVIKWTQLQIN